MIFPEPAELGGPHLFEPQGLGAFAVLDGLMADEPLGASWWDSPAFPWALGPGTAFGPVHGLGGPAAMQEPELTGDVHSSTIDCWIDFSGGKPDSPPPSPSPGPSTAPSFAHPSPTASLSLSPPSDHTHPVPGKNKQSKRRRSTGSCRKNFVSNEKRDEFLARNRLAASRSRAKKKTFQKELEDRAGKLEEEQKELKITLERLVEEKGRLGKALQAHLEI